MRRLLLATTFSMGAALSLALPAAAETRFEARLVGQAILPAATFLAPPADAPEYFRVSGRFNGPGNLRNETLGSIPGVSLPGYGPRPTGLAMPFPGQPLQGFSGIKPVGDGSYWVTGDNGFGNRRNSPDALLMIHRVRPNFQSGAVAVENTIFLSDPNRVAAFPIVNEATPTRYLTGADFDLESIQPLPDGTHLSLPQPPSTQPRRALNCRALCLLRSGWLASSAVSRKFAGLCWPHVHTGEIADGVVVLRVAQPTQCHRPGITGPRRRLGIECRRDPRQQLFPFSLCRLRCVLGWHVAQSQP
ncbi:MAG: esterase-like activity of phytase family protein, partial [Roseococcus sp.]